MQFTATRWMWHGWRQSAVFGVAQVALTWAYKLVENAMLSWGDDRIAAWLGITSAPTISTIISWAIPVLLAACTLWIYHLAQKRWFAAGLKAPTWTPLIAVRQWAIQAGWDFKPNTAAGHNAGLDFVQRLRQAAFDSKVAFRGRLYEKDLPEHSKEQEILIDIPAKHFEDFQIDPLRFVDATKNYDLFTGKIAMQKEQLRKHI
jgi:hypothetical protein